MNRLNNRVMSQQLDDIILMLMARTLGPQQIIAEKLIDELTDPERIRVRRDPRLAGVPVPNNLYSSKHK